MQNTQTKTKRYDYGKSLLQIDKGLHKHVRRIALSNDVRIHQFMYDVIQAGLRALNYPEYSTKNERVAS